MNEVSFFFNLVFGIWDSPTSCLLLVRLTSEVLGWFPKFSISSFTSVQISLVILFLLSCLQLFSSSFPVCIFTCFISGFSVVFKDLTLTQKGCSEVLSYASVILYFLGLGGAVTGFRCRHIFLAGFHCVLLWCLLIWVWNDYDPRHWYWHIMIDTSSVQNKERLVRAAREEDHVTYKSGPLELHLTPHQRLSGCSIPVGECGGCGTPARGCFWVPLYWPLWVLG